MEFQQAKLGGLNQRDKLYNFMIISFFKYYELFQSRRKSIIFLNILIALSKNYQEFLVNAAKERFIKFTIHSNCRYCNGIFILIYLLLLRL